MTMPNILVVDSDPAIRDLLGELLGDEGYQVRLLDPYELWPWQITAAARPDLVLLELPPGMGQQTLALVEQLRHQLTVWLPVIVCTTDPRQVERLTDELGRLGCTPLLKPFELEPFVQLIRQQLRSDDGSSLAMRTTCA